jgi:hypothetical protein
MNLFKYFKLLYSYKMTLYTFPYIVLINGKMNINIAG